MLQQNVLSCSKLTMLSENHLQNLIFLNIFSHCRIVYKIDISFQYLFNKYQLGAADQKFCVTEVFFWTGFNAEHTHVPLSVFEQNYTRIGNSYLLTASLRKQILFTLIILQSLTIYTKLSYFPEDKLNRYILRSGTVSTQYYSFLAQHKILLLNLLPLLLLLSFCS